MSAVERDAVKAWIAEHEDEIVWGADGHGTCGVLATTFGSEYLVGVVERSGVISNVFAGYTGADLERLESHIHKLRSS